MQFCMHLSIYVFFKVITECTLAGAIDLASSRTLPFHWDDASDFQVTENLAVAAFNQVITRTLRPM